MVWVYTERIPSHIHSVVENYMFPVTKWNFLYGVEEKFSFHDQTKKMFNFENFTPFSSYDFSRSSLRRVVENLNMIYFLMFELNRCWFVS